MSKSTAMSTVAAIILVASSTFFCMASSQAPLGSPMGLPAGAPYASGPVAEGPSSGSDCMTLLFNLSDCLGYVQVGSNLTVPDKNCCPELAGLVDSNPLCLCQLLSSGASAYNINVDRALALPGICKVSTPPVSTCAAVGYPVAAPASTSLPPGTTSLPPGVQPPALAASPASGRDGSGATGIGKPPPAALISVVLAAALFLTFF